MKTVLQHAIKVRFYKRASQWPLNFEPRQSTRKWKALYTNYVIILTHACASLYSNWIFALEREHFGLKASPAKKIIVKSASHLTFPRAPTWSRQVKEISNPRVPRRRERAAQSELIAGQTATHVNKAALGCYVLRCRELASGRILHSITTFSAPLKVKAGNYKKDQTRVPTPCERIRAPPHVSFSPTPLSFISYFALR